MGEGASLGSCVGLSGPFTCFTPSLGWAGLSMCLSLLDHCSFGLWFASEPGYYEDGAFGIRIENVVLVVPVKTKVSN